MIELFLAFLCGVVVTVFFCSLARRAARPLPPLPGPREFHDRNVRTERDCALN